MLTLGIDPGSINIGYGVLDKQGRKINYVGSGVIQLGDESTYLKRLSIIPEKIENIIRVYRPDHIAMESLIFVKSPTSLIKLAQARGAILSVILKDYHDLFFEYSPNLVKVSSAGHGHATKEGIKTFLHQLIGKSDFDSHDESDAIAIALCHIMNYSESSSGKIEIVKTRGPANSLSNSLKHKVKEQSR